jgi:hypothetical protein
MLQRCRNPNNRDYRNYGARGIAVCERWLSFENFYADMGDPPPGMSIDRVNNDLGYSAKNCRWATTSEQNRNRRPSHKWKRRRADLAQIFAYTNALARAAGGTRAAP